MSKGNPIIKCRVSERELAAIMLQIQRRNQLFVWLDELDITRWLREAIAEKLDHPRRAAVARARRRAKSALIAGVVTSGDSGATSENSRQSGCERAGQNQSDTSGPNGPHPSPIQE